MRVRVPVRCETLPAGGAFMMRNMIRRILSPVAVSLLLIAGGNAQAATMIVKNANGTVSVTTDGQETLLSAGLAAAIVDAVKRNTSDPESLRAAIRALVAGNAGGADDAALATAIAAFAAASSSGGSEVVTAIVEGAAAGNPSLSAVAVLGALPAAPSGVPRAASRPSQGTVENLQQISPVS